MKSISVIIPVYNVARYLPECLDSVLSQDYTALEVILIDDGSTDDSGLICDAYAEKDGRIRVIHQQNAGSGAAKNTGLRVATGEYLTFLDSDDYLEQGAYAHMVSLMENNQVDVVQCMLQYVYKDGVQPQVYEPGRKIYTMRDYLMRYTYDWTCALMTEKLFRRKLFESIFFEEGNVIDDEFFTYRGIMNAERILRDDRVVYSYRQRKSSVTKTEETQTRIFRDFLNYQNKRRKNVAQKFPELRRYFDMNYLEALIHAGKCANTTEQTLRMIRCDLRKYFFEPGNSIPGVRIMPELVKTFFSKVDWAKEPKNGIIEVESSGLMFD